MKKTLLVGLATAMMVMGANAQAAGNEGATVGVSTGIISLGDTPIRTSVTTLAIGYQFPMADNVYSEVQAKLGFTGVGSGTVNGSTTEMSADSLMGAYYKVGMNPAPKVLVYGLVGYASMKYKVTVSPFTATATKSGLSYGVGASYEITDSKHLGIEYVDYPSDSTVSATSITLSKAF